MDSASAVSEVNDENELNDVSDELNGPPMKLSKITGYQQYQRNILVSWALLLIL